MSANYLKELLRTITEIKELALNHCDPDADENDTSPDDMTAHINGLIVQKCQVLIKILRKQLKESKVWQGAPLNKKIEKEK